MVTRAVENAQKQIEELNYERRKNVLKYDDVMNHQREVIYGERRKILEGYDFGDQALRDGRAGGRRDVVAAVRPPDVFAEEWDVDALFTALAEVYPGRRSTKDELADVATIRTSSRRCSSRRRWPRTTAKEKARDAAGRCAISSAWSC